LLGTPARERRSLSKGKANFLMRLAKN